MNNKDITCGLIYGYKLVVKDVPESEYKGISKLVLNHLETMNKNYLEHMQCKTTIEMQNFLNKAKEKNSFRRKIIALWSIFFI